MPLDHFHSSPCLSYFSLFSRCLSPRLMINHFFMFPLVNNTKTHLNKKDTIRSHSLGCLFPFPFLFLSTLNKIHLVFHFSLFRLVSFFLHFTFLHFAVIVATFNKAPCFVLIGCLLIFLFAASCSRIITFYINNKAIFHVMNLLSDESIYEKLNFLRLSCVKQMRFCTAHSIVPASQLFPRY